MSMEFKRQLPIPKEVKQMYPVSDKAAKVKAELDKEIADVFTGKSQKKILIIGPCSADRGDAVFEYCSRLKRVQEQVTDKLILIPRVYTNKPRTTGDGYKGMLHQPDPNEKPNPFKGVLAIRALHTRILTELGMSTADEMLYPANYWYLSPSPAGAHTPLQWCSGSPQGSLQVPSLKGFFRREDTLRKEFSRRLSLQSAGILVCSD